MMEVLVLLDSDVLSWLVFLGASLIIINNNNNGFV